MSQMEKDVQARIRALPGNSVCCDCANLNPQWASISYGSLMCLECSGHHRSIGVHLSFVRSIQMDSWTERQIKAMEMSGGNAKCVEFFEKRNMDKGMQIAQKYNTKQAAYYREELKARVDGKQPTMSDPGRFDPATAAPTTANGVEAKAGESVDEYNARQAKIRDDARARLAAKFGGGGSMGGVGSQGNSSPGGFQNGGRGSGDGEGLGAVLGGAAGALGCVAAGGWGFLKEKVIDNENVRDKVGGLAQLAGNAVGAVRNTVRDGDTIEALKRNIAMQEGSAMSSGLQWGSGTAKNIWESAPAMGDLFGDEGGAGGAPSAPKCPTCGAALRTEPQFDMKCTLCRGSPTRYSCSRGCNYNICTKCFEKPAQDAAKAARSSSGAAGGGGGGGGKKQALDDFNFDDDWGDDAPAPADPTKEDMAKLAKEMGMNLSNSGAPQLGAQAKAGAGSGGYPAAAAPTQSKADQEETKRILAIKAMDLSAPAPKAEPKKKAGLAKSDDFFADFDM